VDVAHTSPQFTQTSPHTMIPVVYRRIDSSSDGTDLTEEEARYAEEVLRESEQAREECLDHLRQWIKEQSDVAAKTDCYNLLKFLRACKFDLNKTKKKLECYYKIRADVPEWYSERDPFLPEMQALLDIGVFLPLLKRDPEGRLIVTIRIAAHNPAIHDQNNVFKIGMMVLDHALNQDRSTSLYGICAIFDMEGVSYAHAMQLTLGMIRKAVHSWQNCYPVRVKGLHFINSPMYINVVLNIFRRFMNEKLRERIFVHGSDMKSLHKFIPRSVLPEEYGGLEGTLTQLKDHWKIELEGAAQFLKEDEKYKWTSEST